MVKDPSDIHKIAERIFAAQPFSAHIGAELVSTGPETVVLRLIVRPQHLQQHGLVHGGVLSYLADNAITFAGGIALGGDALTSEFKINYLRPARGSEIVARASAASAGRRQAVCRCDLFAVSEGDETACALAQGTVVRAG